MKFKCNKATTLINSFILIFLCSLPGLLLYSLVTVNDNKYISINDVLYLFLTIVIIVIISNIVSFIIGLNSDDYILLNDNHFIYKDNYIEYSKIKHIKYYYGDFPRHSKWTKASLNFYDENEELFFFIDNPSYIMCIALILKCKNVKFKIIDLYKLLIMSVIILIVSIIFIFI